MQYWWTAETSLLNTHFNIVREWLKSSKPCILIFLRGSFVVDKDNSRSILGIICGTVLLFKCKFNSGKIRPLLTDWATRRQINAVRSERTTFWHHCRGHLKSLTKVASSSFEFDHSSLSFWSVNNSFLWPSNLSVLSIFYPLIVTWQPLKWDRPD